MKRFVYTSAALAGLAAPALAQPEINWQTIDGGGGVLAGGVFELGGTIGQPDAGVAMTGGAFTLQGGFWVSDACPADFNLDGFVDFFDFDDFVIAFESGDPSADFNSDSFIDFFDFDDFTLAFETGC
jgi:hypothetical protein